MADRDQEISREPLWSIPVPIQDRLKASAKDREYDHFLMCGLYSAVAISFLLLFGFDALLRGEEEYAAVIFGFAIATFAVYAIAWNTRQYDYAKHLLTLLMGMLCLYLFYTGGTVNTGPLYYFIFPLVAIFLQGLYVGLGSVVVLLILTVVVHSGVLGFDTDRYTEVFFLRIGTVYFIVTLLTVMFEYFRIKAERELLISADDLNHLIYGDLATSLANRRLMEKLLVAELIRLKRYPGDCCVMFIEPDYLRVHTARYGVRFAHTARMLLTGLLHYHLRESDIPGRWDETRFMVLLPETTAEGAAAVAERMIAECSSQSLEFQGSQVKFTLSIGIAAWHSMTADEFIAAATANLSQARREGGNRLVVS